MCAGKVGKLNLHCQLVWIGAPKYPWNKTTIAMSECLREQINSSPGFSRLSYHTGEASKAFKNIEDPVFIE